MDLIPEEYDWKVALKKIVYTALKVVVAGVVYKQTGTTMTPDAQATTSVAVASALEALHDWAKLRFPSFGWL